MHRLATLAAAAALTLCLSGAIVCASGGDDKAAPKALTNAYCPIMGTDSPADPAIRTEHEGQYVYFCCEGCLNTFKKDPAKYIAKMSPEEQAAIKANDTCPLSGEKITDRSVRSEANGKLVYFCCEHCKTAFDKKQQPQRP